MRVKTHNILSILCALLVYLFSLILYARTYNQCDDQAERASTIALLCYIYVLGICSTLNIMQSKSFTHL